MFKPRNCIISRNNLFLKILRGTKALDVIENHALHFRKTGYGSNDFAISSVIRGASHGEIVRQIIEPGSDFLEDWFHLSGLAVRVGRERAAPEPRLA